MKNFYRTDSKGNVFIGKGENLPDGFIEFSLLNDNSYPKEVQDALDIERNIFDNSTKIVEYKKYLLNTDWYYIRKLETGKEIPADIVAKRIELRALINSLEEK